MRRLLLLALACAVVASCVVGSAASLGGVSGARLGAGAAVVVGCDTDGVTTAYTTSGGRVTTVTVGGLATACAGATLSLTLTGAGNASVGTGGGTVAGTSLGVSITPQPTATSVTGVHIVIQGP
jgi:hypothetical protein